MSRESQVGSVEVGDEFRSWLFRTVAGVYHTDPANDGETVFDTFLIELPNDKCITVTPENAAEEMENLKEAFGEAYPDVFDEAAAGFIS